MACNSYAKQFFRQLVLRCSTFIFPSAFLVLSDFSSNLISSHLSLNTEDRWGTTDDFATSFLYFPLFSTALWDLPKSKPVRSLMSSHLFLCLPCLLPPFTVPCKMGLQCASLNDDQEVFIWSNCLLDLGTDFLVGTLVVVVVVFSQTCVV